MSYSRILAHYPYVVLGVVSFVAITCIVVILTVAPSPDFTDPKLGFETRGTTLASRLHSLELLLEETSTDFSHTSQTSALQQHVQKRPPGNTTRHPGDDDYDDEDEEEDEHGDINGTNSARQDSFFCDMPRPEYARVVFKSQDENSLFNASKLQSMCEIEDLMIRSQSQFPQLCVRETVSEMCCRSWSLGNYVALLNDKTSCYDITDQDVSRVLATLSGCVTYYRDGSLKPDCYGLDGLTSTGQCSDNVPVPCQEYNAVYHILHYIADVDFLSKQSKGLKMQLTYSITLLPIASSLASEDLYKAVERQTLSDDQVKVVAVNFGLKQQLFEFYLKKDMLWIFVAMLTVWLSMWFYTASLFLTFMTLVSITLSLCISYFIYTMVFEIKFFPFMNLLAVVILLGVGCDDVFVYTRVWTMAKLEKNVGTLEKVISDTLKHAALSMLVTSLTTACAFFANYVSDITALQCFGIYTGTAIMVNFVMMITWIPASIVIQDKWCSECCLCCSLDTLSQRNRMLYILLRGPTKAYDIVCDWSRIFFEKILACVVIKLRILWIIIFGVLGGCSVVIVLYYPQLKLPSSNQFQVFAQDHPFEVYDLQMRDKFWFEKGSTENVGTMPLTVVWGIKQVDNGNHLDPFSEGSLEYDPNFKVSSPEAQSWLLSFCSSIRSFGMYQPENGPQLSNCFIESFKRFMQRDCKGVLGEKFEPCCRISEFPYPAEVFERCLKVWIPMLTRSKLIYPTNRFAGPRYNKETGQLQALIVEFTSTVPFTFNYVKMKEFYKSANELVTGELVKAPTEMQQGWFISLLDFYDLQHSISSGTPFAIGVSLAIASVVAFLTTMNVLVTLYAMASITISIFATVAVLVLLGWQLNILESVTISIAVGLSIDFTLHYGMAYRLAPDLDKILRVSTATSRMGAPIAMAALTTFLAGALMMPSTILAYRQLGTFLMLVMSISWLYATFFFLSLLKTIGPDGSFGQFHLPSCYCCFGSGEEHIDKTVYTMSDSNMSNSVTHINSSETHELEPLTERIGMLSSHGSSKQTSNVSLSTALGRSREEMMGSGSSVKEGLDMAESAVQDDEEEEEEEEEETLREDSKLLLNGTEITSTDVDAEAGLASNGQTGTPVWLKKPLIDNSQQNGL